MSDEAQLLSQVQAGEPRALSRLCRRIEEGVVSEATLDALFATQPKPWLIGITGSPGAGKSTLVSRLVTAYRARQQRVGVVAVDPTSPFSGGALLGDRIRMQEHLADPDVFVRSLATRGAQGGLAAASFDCALAMGLWGAQIVFLETVGVGQAELDVMEASDTIVVVLAPGMGDDVQAQKAGILEIADLLVVNKADLPGAERTFAELQAMLSLGAASRSAVGHSAASHSAASHSAASHSTTSHSAITVSGHGSHAHARAAIATNPHDARASGAAAAGAQDLHPATDGPWSPRLKSCVAQDGTHLPEVVAALDAHHLWLATPSGQTRARERTTSGLHKRLQRLLLTELESRRGAELQTLSHAVSDGTSTLSQALKRVRAMLAS